MIEKQNLIILVDDIPLNNEIMKLMLSKWANQLKIEQLENAKCLLDTIKNSPYNKILVFLDLQMPIMDGYEFLKIWTLEKKTISKYVSIVVVSATELYEFKKSGYFYLIDDYFLKPVDFEKLQLVINNFLAT